VQQVGDNRTVMGVRGGRHDGMNQLGPAIRANVRLHAKAPFVALPRLVHLGIALAVLVLG
jgi:hypothetical protein